MWQKQVKCKPYAIVPRPRFGLGPVVNYCKCPTAFCSIPEYFYREPVGAGAEHVAFLENRALLIGSVLPGMLKVLFTPTPLCAIFARRDRRPAPGRWAWASAPCTGRLSGQV